MTTEKANIEKWREPHGFGFSAHREDYEAVVAYREAALRDGWTMTPTYQSEPAERACHLAREGFTMSLLTRTGSGKWAYEAHIAAWGPDGIALEVPAAYSFEQMQWNLRKCGFCGKEDVETQRIAFCNRSCAECAPEAAKQLEYPGWCD